MVLRPSLNPSRSLLVPSSSVWLGFPDSDSDSLDGDSDGNDRSRQKVQDCRTTEQCSLLAVARMGFLLCHACCALQDLRSLKKKYKQEEVCRPRLSRETFWISEHRYFCVGESLSECRDSSSLLSTLAAPQHRLKSMQTQARAFKPVKMEHHRSVVP